MASARRGSRRGPGAPRPARAPRPSAGAGPGPAARAARAVGVSVGRSAGRGQARHAILAPDLHHALVDRDAHLALRHVHEKARAHHDQRVPARPDAEALAGRLGRDVEGDLAGAHLWLPLGVQGQQRARPHLGPRSLPESADQAPPALVRTSAGNSAGAGSLSTSAGPGAPPRPRPGRALPRGRRPGAGDDLRAGPDPNERRTAPRPPPTPPARPARRPGGRPARVPPRVLHARPHPALAHVRRREGRRLVQRLAEPPLARLVRVVEPPRLIGFAHHTLSSCHPLQIAARPGEAGSRSAFSAQSPMRAISLTGTPSIPSRRGPAPGGARAPGGRAAPAGTACGRRRCPTRAAGSGPGPAARTAGPGPRKRRFLAKRMASRVASR